MQDQELRVTPTHGSEEYPGTVFGIETTRFGWVGLALLAGLAWLGALSSQMSLLDAAPYAAAPVGIVVVYLRFFQQGRPPGFALDLLDQLLTGGHARPPIESSLTVPDDEDPIS
mgnify:CR=1 FL=1